jgi:hypothetical protein
MRRRFRSRLTYSNVMSSIAVFLALGTGTAYATHLVVNSSDVVNESLLSEDLKDGAAVRSSDVVNGQISGADLADGTVASADVRNEALTGSDVESDSLTGADIREGTLGQVRTATLGGLGRSAASGLCDPETWTHVRCVQVSLDLASPARVLLNGRVTAHVDGDAPSGFSALGICRWGGVQQSGDLFVDADDGFEDMSLVGLTNVIPAGRGYTFAIECREGGNAGVHYSDAWITAVAISPS